MTWGMATPWRSRGSDVIRDFIYLDLPRLQSFASQLLEGLPESETRERGHQTDFAGEVKAGLPGLLGAAVNTKAVLSASSTVTSRARTYVSEPTSYTI